MLIELWADSYAPGMIQRRIGNQRKLKKVVDYLKTQGQGQGQEDTFLLDEDDSRSLLGDKTHEEARDYGVKIQYAEFEVLTFYGYDCNTLKL